MRALGKCNYRGGRTLSINAGNWVRFAQKTSLKLAESSGSGGGVEIYGGVWHAKPSPAAARHYRPTVPENGDKLLTKELTNLLAKKFIARPDVKAVQRPSGTWMPVTTDGKRDSPKVPWSRVDLEQHLSGKKTYGHYVLSTDDEVKLMCFDIDLRRNVTAEEAQETGTEPWSGTWQDEDGELHLFNPREDWLNRSHPSRAWVKYDLKMLATKLLNEITELDIHGVVAYSGGKGIHVYGLLPEPTPAAVAREGASIVLDSIGEFTPEGSSNTFYKATDQSPAALHRNISIEVFPKQDSLGNGGLGNLLRAPLGRNLRNPKDPTFFVDMRTAMGQMIPRDPIEALTQDPWKD